MQNGVCHCPKSVPHAWRTRGAAPMSGLWYSIKGMITALVVSHYMFLDVFLLLVWIPPTWYYYVSRSRKTRQAWSEAGRLLGLVFKEKRLNFFGLKLSDRRHIFYLEGIFEKVPVRVAAERRKSLE